MNKSRFKDGISLFLLGMIVIGLAVMLGRLYQGYLRYGEKVNNGKTISETEYETIQITNNNSEDGLEAGESVITEVSENQDYENLLNAEKNGDYELITDTAPNQIIRVCLRTSDYSQTLHEYVELFCEVPYKVSWICRKDEKARRFTQNKEELLQKETDIQGRRETEKTEYLQTESYEYAAGEVFSVDADDMQAGEVLKIFKDQERVNEMLYSDKIMSESLFSVNSITRTQGTPQYRGDLYLCRTNTGILVINELPLEQYLPCVVASEMPSSYPEEAQKAQAVCARTYAVNCIRNRNQKSKYEELLLEWSQSDERKERQLYDLDDSVEFQVYNNQKETDLSKSAVTETEGKILDLEEVLYYSTSAGTSHRTDLSDTEDFSCYLKKEPETDAEYSSPWLRWTVDLETDVILENLRKYERADFDKITAVSVQERSGNGQVRKLKLSDGQESVLIEGEYWIRKILGSSRLLIHLRNGNTIDGMSMLPSGFFVIDEEERKADDADEVMESELLTENTCVSDGTGELNKNADTEKQTDISELKIRGGGYGHGIGMSQYGAADMAAEGSSCEEILEYYYGTAGKKSD